ncbi:hypothetical protein L207DRAFT_230501 [Hyaloscypha variabilis F]|uniref:Zn(2)-C6 fungal-type domain-containing protein n=1 Tax=Hyaloscypha variabilis (strain UAMH 11265 / GT02V1 / F) TaxID=1149755 RepID=A0A2J6QUW2_HYAVF|nr:hypothetical protein L207DRAFT_230501 [Hyaloscypha variabilis F]
MKSRYYSAPSQTMAKHNPKTTKRTRKGGHRGKTGCSTCRTRHVKCDEGKPSCLNCTSTGRKCDGYQCIEAPNILQALPLLAFAQSYTNQTSPWNDSQVTLATTLGLPSNEQNNRLFHSFLQDCVPSLTEAMDSEFWRRSILRASSSPAVQHAAIAFGAVYEQRMLSQNMHSGQDGKRLELTSSLRYAVAIRTLRYCTAEPSQTPEMLEEIMIACLIFIFMEILRGDDVAAATHLDGALKIYSCARSTGEVHIQAKENKITSDIDIAVGSITKSFLRLDIQSVLYMGSRTPWEPGGISVMFRASEDIPAMFETFLDARDSLYALLAKILNFITPPEGAEKCFPAWCPHPDRGFDIYTVFHGSTYRDYHLPKAITQRRHLMHLLSRWKSAFQGFLKKGTPKTPDTLTGCALLWLTYHATRIKLAVAYTHDECCYDEHLPSFKKILEQAELYLKYTAQTPRSHTPTPTDPNDRLANNMPSLKPRQTYFKVHSSVCYPLYYTALKCRSKTTRQSALSMLRNVDSEGVWDVNMLTKIAEFVITIEEESTGLDRHRSLVDTPQFGVPEANRIHCLSLNIVKDLKSVWLRYNRRVLDTKGEISRSSDPLERWRIDSTVLTWKNSPTENTETLSPGNSVPAQLASATLSSENRTPLSQSLPAQC